MPLTKAQIARLQRLQEKKHRTEAGLFVIEGAKVVTELLAAGYPLLELYATPAWLDGAGRTAVPDGPTMTRVTEAEMARISHFPTPAPVLAVARIETPALADGELANGYTLALDGIQDPGNVGTLLRIADWFGFARVLVSPDCADRFSPKVIHASMGSFARMRTLAGPLPELLRVCPVPVIGCDLSGEPLETYAPPKAAVVVIGSEGRGLSSEVAALLTTRLTIRRYGGAESLNAAVAAGIVCAHLRRAPG